LVPLASGFSGDNGAYRFKHLRFASAFIQERVYDKFANEVHSKLMLFTREAAGNPLLSSILGCLYEEFVHRRLCGNETFRIRALDGPSSSDEQVNFGGLLTKTINCAEDVSAGYYCKPAAHNFESVDAVIAPHSLFQVTVGSTHPVKQHGVDVLSGSMTASEVRLYFVVPSDRFSTFRSQPYVTKDGMSLR
jgi:hypothetical protein